jgi:hypothetical protein
MTLPENRPAECPRRYRRGKPAPGCARAERDAAAL